MIKKLTIGAAVLALLIFVAVLIFKRNTGPSEAAMLVPGDTVLFINVPNVPRTALRWQGTALAKIGKEPEVKAFLEKPLAKLMSDPGASEASTLLRDLKPGNLFVAITSLTASDATGLVGFQFWGDRKSFDTAVERLRKQAGEPREDLPSEMHNGIEIRISRHSGKSRATAVVGRWGFVGSDAAIVRDALDRASGKGDQPPLAQDVIFQKVSERLLASPDFMVYVRTGPLVDALLAVGESMGATAIPEQVEQLRSTQAAGFTWAIDGSIQRDALFLLSGNPREPATLDHVIARFTSPDTVAFLETTVRSDKLVDLLGRSPFLTNGPSSQDLARLAGRAFGPDAGLVVDWPSGRMTPSPIGLVEMHDPAAGREFLDALIQRIPGASVADTDGLRIYSLTNGANPLMAPAAVLSGNLVVAALDPATAIESAGNPNTSNVPAASGFGPYESTFREANELFAFVDTKPLFERAYTALRPVAIFGAAVMPGLSDMIDPSKLPQTETIAQHLSPIVLSQRTVEDGSLVESSGPLTAHQATIVLMLGGTAFSRLAPGQ